MRILHISAQKPDYTGSGVYMTGIIDAMGNLSSEQAMIVGIDKYDDIEKIRNKFNKNVSVEAVVYNTGKLDFNVPGMSDNMPYPSTRYRDITNYQAMAIKSVFEEVLIKKINSFKPDLIICHHLYYTSSICVEIIEKKYKNIKVCAICHGTCLRQLKTNIFMKEYILEMIPKIDIIFALHDAQKEDIIEIFAIENREKVEVLGSGYNKKIFNINENIKSKIYKRKVIKIAYAGKIAFSKGLREFIRALNLLKYEKDDIEVVFMGQASDENEYRTILEMASTCKYCVKFTGRVSQEKMATILNCSDIFVLPSYYEGLPLVILEAMACGNYVICSDIEGMRGWLGKDIVSNDLLNFVKLPEMINVSQPKEDYIPQFIEDISKALDKAIDYRKRNRNTSINISSLSWDSLGKKLYELVNK